MIPLVKVIIPLATLTGSLLLAACGGTTPATPAPSHQPGQATPILLENGAQPPPAPARASSAAPPRFIQKSVSGVQFRGVSFDARNHRLQVIDQAEGPGSRYPDASAVAKSHPAICVINGGFFTPTGAPLGLVVAEGTISGTWNSASSLGSALWQDPQSGTPVILRRSSSARQAATTMRSLLQAGPLLIEAERPVSGLENEKISARTFLLWDGRDRWWMGLSSPCTLARLASILSEHPPTPWRPTMAINLDGGRTSEIWVSSSLTGQALHHRPIWNRPVRNFLGLIPR